MESAEIIKGISDIFNPHFSTLTGEINGLKSDYKELRTWLEKKLEALSCKEHGEQMSGVEKELIEIRAEVKANKLHNDRQDLARDKKEGRLWAVTLAALTGMLTFAGGLALILFKS